MTAKGDRVVLVRCTDPYSTRPAGSEGTVTLVDAMGTVHVQWDDGGTLGLVPDEDVWEVVGPPTCEAFNVRRQGMCGQPLTDLGDCPRSYEHGDHLAAT